MRSMPSATHSQPSSSASACRVLVGVGDPGEFGTGEIRDMAGMTGPHAADTDDTDASRRNLAEAHRVRSGRGSAATPRIV